MIPMICTIAIPNIRGEKALVALSREITVAEIAEITSLSNRSVL
jgi:hypothetical protein